MILAALVDGKSGVKSDCVRQCSARRRTHDELGLGDIAREIADEDAVF